MSIKGYWHNWERSTAWLAREIAWYLIQTNGFIKNENKPTKRTDLMRLSDDKEIKTTEIEEGDDEIFNKLKNGVYSRFVHKD